MRRTFLLASLVLLAAACKSEAPPAEAPPAEAPPVEEPVVVKPPAPEQPVNPAPAAPAGEESGAEAAPTEKAPANLEEAGFDTQVAALEKQFEAALEGLPMEDAPRPTLDGNLWPRPCQGLDRKSHRKVKDLPKFCVPKDLLQIAFEQGSRFTGMPGSYSDDDPVAALVDPLSALEEESALTKAEREAARAANRNQLRYFDLPLSTCTDVPNEDQTGREMNCDFSADRLHVSRAPRLDCTKDCEVRSAPWSPSLSSKNLQNVQNSLLKKEPSQRLFVMFEIHEAWRAPLPNPLPEGETHTKIHGIISPVMLAIVECSTLPCTQSNMTASEVFFADKVVMALENGPHRVRLECSSPNQCVATTGSI